MEAAVKDDRQLLTRAISGELGSITQSELNAALQSASQNGNAVCVSMLIAQGADVDDEDGDGDTPLMLAAGNGYASECGSLLYLYI